MDDRTLIELRTAAIRQARRMGLSHADADDAAQDVCIRALVQIGKDKTITNPAAWSRQATRNLVLNQKRDGSRAKRGGGLIESLDGLEELEINIAR
jgi:DNA-directed RNA polymerase specialized sigma24 family protein